MRKRHLEFLRQIEPMLEDIFICSSVEVAQGVELGKIEAFPELRIEVLAAAGGKCPVLALPGGYREAS